MKTADQKYRQRGDTQKVFGQMGGKAFSKVGHGVLISLWSVVDPLFSFLDAFVKNFMRTKVDKPEHRRLADGEKPERLVLFHQPQKVPGRLAPP